MLVSVPAESAIQKPKQPKASCRIEVDNAHISSWYKKAKGADIVKVNARSICNVYQTKVTLTVKLYKVEFPVERFLWQSETDELDPRSSGFVVRNYGTYAVCKNHKITSYYGIAVAKAMIAGEWLYAGKTRSPQNYSLPCGT